MRALFVDIQITYGAIDVINYLLYPHYVIKNKE
jgi:hypothetical protein